jgi:DNA-binding NtrC family response regulator
LNRNKILIIDDDESVRKVLGFILEDAGYDVSKASSGDQGIESIKSERPDLVITDMKMPDGDGMTFLKQAKKLDPSIPIIILTAYGTIETAVEAMKIGAIDYITKPISRDELTLTVAKILKLSRLEKENEALRMTVKNRFRFENIVGLSAAMTKVFDVVSRVAGTDASILITGESGTGKELIAKAIHFNSARKDARLVTVNCAAIPSELLESELFGHVRGAFTGAIRNKDGKFQLAQGGTLFLDEIGSMPLSLQAKLLRALQEKEVERIGEEKATAVDVRIVAATNRNLPELIRSGKFREDLFYRLNVVPIHLPPLRERMSDIPLLVRHFTAKYAPTSSVTFTKAAMAMLDKHDWPGNVRELENFCERLILMRAKEVISEDEVRSQLEEVSKEQSVFSAPSFTLPELERQAIMNALSKSYWNQSQAARMLGIPRHVLLYRMKKFNIVPADEKKRDER